MDLEEYNFEIRHIRGKENVQADALSRMIPSKDDSDVIETIHIDDIKNTFKEESQVFAITRSMAKQPEEITETNQNNVNDGVENKINVYEELESKYDRKIPRLRTMNNHEMCAHKTKKQIFSVRIPLINNKIDLESFMLKLERLANEEGFETIQIPVNDHLFTYVSLNDFKETGNKVLKTLKIMLITPPQKITNEQEKITILQQFHNDEITGGHCGQKRLYANIRSHYQWKGMTKDVAKFVRKCKNCQLNKITKKTKEPMHITDTPQKPFDTIILDTIGPMAKSDNGNIYAVTLICDVTKFLITVAIPNKEARTVARAIFNNCILIFGPMIE